MAMGGVGEAMLLGAAMGGGSAALTGGDPLKGALLGGLTGGAGAGIAGALPGAGANAALGTGLSAGTAGTTGLTAGTTGLTAGTTGLTSGAASTGATLGSNLGGNLAAINTGIAPAASYGFTAPTTGLTAAGGSTGLSPALAQSGLQSTGVNYGVNAASTAPGAASNYAVGAPSVAPGGAGIQSLLPPPGAAPTAAAPQTFTEGMAKFANDPLASMKANKGIAFASALQGATGARKDVEGPEEYDGPLKRFRFNPETYRAAMYAEGGITNLAAGGYDRMVGEQPMYQALAKGGISDLGGYSDYAGGGRMLKGPGDGMSDSIPASIAGKRPARLARDEFVVPADVVSGLGNGSSDAGAKQLYAMMDRVRKARTGTKKQGREINARRFMPA